METLSLTLSAFSRRSGSLVVKHSATSLTRGLEPGETLLLRDGERFHSAVVADVSFELDDTHYRLTLGPEISEEEAFEARRDALLSAAHAGQSRVDTFELLGLLRSARTLQQQAGFLRDRLGESALS